MKNVDRANVWSDGSAGPSGPGGYAAIIQLYHFTRTKMGYVKFHTVELAGTDPNTNSQRAELQAGILALQWLRDHDIRTTVLLYSDSRYLTDGFTGLIQKWDRQQWIGYSGAPIKNQDLWKKIRELSASQHVLVEHVKSHTGVLLNERADELARAARLSIS